MLNTDKRGDNKNVQKDFMWVGRYMDTKWTVIIKQQWHKASQAWKQQQNIVNTIAHIPKTIPSIIIINMKVVGYRGNELSLCVDMSEIYRHVSSFIQPFNFNEKVSLVSPIFTNRLLKLIDGYLSCLPLKPKDKKYSKHPVFKTLCFSTLILKQSEKWGINPRDVSTYFC